jgi:hypothetical protein
MPVAGQLLAQVAHIEQMFAWLVSSLISGLVVK